jgi:calcineurin-like phosphoesterase family protein
MKLAEYEFNCQSRSTSWSIYAIGDVHIGAANCAEEKLVKLVKTIKDNPNAYWFGGGDMCDAVILTDVKRFDPSILPDWLLKGNKPSDVRNNLTDILEAQKKRLFKLLEPIRGRCLGLIEGNHEYTIMKYHNRDFMSEMCKHFGVDGLTDCAFVRLKFRRNYKSSNSVSPHNSAVVRAFICHGHGGGRTSGAEPNNLYRLAADKECDIIMKGHSHSFCVHPPIPMLSLPSRGELPQDPIVYDKYAGNWGSFVYTYKTGPSTYASRANYPVRPMYTFEVNITPFCTTNERREQVKIAMDVIRL